MVINFSRVSLGVYKLSPRLNAEHWDVIKGIKNISPNPYLKTMSGITNLSDID